MNDLFFNILNYINENYDYQKVPHKNSLADSILENIEEINTLRESLSDEKSKKILDQMITMRILLPFFEKEKIIKQYHPYTEKEWKSFVNQAQKMECPIKEDYILDRIETWILDGYSYNECTVTPGDVVIDGGAYTGNTAVYFSQKAGPTGKIYSFEAAEKTYSILAKNISSLGYSNIIPLKKALSDKKSTLFFAGDTPGARIVTSGEYKVDAISIDEFIIEEKINKIDFIKLDIEGAEKAALEGCKKVIEKHHPKLAICIYHKPNDIFEIFKLIQSFNVAYNFYLKLNSSSFHEFVLFCMPCSIKNKTLPTDISLSYSYIDSIKNLIKHHYYIYQESLFSLIKNELKKIIYIPFTFIHESKQCFLYMPFSNTLRLHYEFLIRNNNMDICIHFENPNENIRNTFKLMTENLEKIQKSIPYKLHIKNFSEICFKIPLDYTLEQAHFFAYFMNIFINNTLPFLVEGKDLLSPDIAFYYLNKNIQIKE